MIQPPQPPCPMTIPTTFYVEIRLKPAEQAESNRKFLILCTPSTTMRDVVQKALLCQQMETLALGKHEQVEQILDFKEFKKSSLVYFQEVQMIWDEILTENTELMRSWRKGFIPKFFVEPFTKKSIKKNRQLRLQIKSKTKSWYEWMLPTPYMCKVESCPSYKHKNFVISYQDCEINVPSDDLFTVSDLKSKLWKNEYFDFPITDGMLFHSLDNNLLHVYDESMFLWFFDSPNFVLQRKNSTAIKDEQVMNLRLGKIIGIGMYILDLDDLEVQMFRRSMVSVRANAIQERDPEKYLLAIDLVEPLQSVSFKIKVKYLDVVNTLVCDENTYPEQVIEAVRIKNKRMHAGSVPVDCILRMSAYEQYFDSEFPLIRHASVAKLVSENKVPTIKLVPRESIALLSLNVMETHEIMPPMFPFREMDHEKGHNPLERSFLPSSSLPNTCKIQLMGAVNVSAENIRVQIDLVYQGNSYATFLTNWSSGPNPEFYETFDTGISLSSLPRGIRASISVLTGKRRTSQNDVQESTIYGWVNMLLYDHRGMFKSGTNKLPLWTNEPHSPHGTCCTPVGSISYVTLSLETFVNRVFFSHEPAPEPEIENDEYNSLYYSIPMTEQVIIEQALNSDPLAPLSTEAKTLLVKHAAALLSFPQALYKLILSVEWIPNPDWLYPLLKLWKNLNPIHVLPLLHMDDPVLRSFAISILSTWNDQELLSCLLQLVQALKMEPYLDNTLTRFLLLRALNNRIVGQSFFWFLRSEMHHPHHKIRFSLILEAYVRGCGIVSLYEAEDYVNARLSFVAEEIKKYKALERKQVLSNLLKESNFPDRFSLPLDARWVAKDLVLGKCRYMDSKKLPLWCVFNNVEPEEDPLYVIFKSGDDLRQDMLTLQMIKIMEQVWQKDNLDLRMKPYGCVCSGNEIGMIQVVLEAETVSNIQKSFGGSSAAFKDQPIADWIRQKNPTESSYSAAVDNFTRSCAGYCVATYVLGIGDRHNDNIMVTREGHLFHIDFGHFLGNIKRKFGIKRERAPFVLTPDFVHVMKSKQRFDDFLEYSIAAYRSLYRHRNTFLHLFHLMINTGIPELGSVADLAYLREALCVTKTEDQAAETFRGLIFESIKMGWSTQLNWWIYNLAH